MNITFSEKILKKIANDDKKLIQRFGPKRAKLIRRRLDDMAAAETLEDLRHVPGNYHELKANRKGQWACNLDHPYRLLFVPHENPIPTENGNYIWIEIKGVDITEIKDYH